jgi:putative salt-induced outer membrane protein
MSRSFRSSFLALAATVAWSSVAAAQPAPAGAPASAPTVPAETVKAQTATTGKTDVAKGGFVTSSLPSDEDPKYIDDVSIGLGGLFSAGNARTIAVTSLARARFRRDEHQFSGAAVANFARAGKKGETVETTVENFQGLDLRLNVDPGVAYYFFDTKTHRLQAEIGYDLQHDIRRDASRAQAVPEDAPPGTPPPPPLPKTQTLHNARLFVGYENKLRKEVSLIVSAEYLQNFGDLETYRFIADIGLKSNVAERLALATTYTARYENKPLPNVADLDSIASVNLVYSFF